MTCDIFRPFLSLKLSGSLDAKQARRVEAHLEKCPSCQADLVKAGKLRRLLALKRHEKPDEFFMNTFTAEFHRRVCAEMVQKPSFTQKLSELFEIVRQRMGIVSYSSAAAVAVVAICLFAVHVSTPGIPAEISKTTFVAKAAPASQADRSVVEVESRLNELVLATSQPKSVYVLDRLQYEPPHGSTVLAF